MRKLLAAAPDLTGIFGTVDAPAGSGFAKGKTPAEGLASLIGFFIQIVFLVGGIAALIYLLWGAFDWISSGGEKEKIQKAQNKIVNAIIGLLLLVASFTIFSFLMGTVLGGKFGIGGDFKIKIPGI